MHYHRHKNRFWLDFGWVKFHGEAAWPRFFSVGVRCSGEDGLLFNFLSLYFSIYFRRFSKWYWDHDAYDLGVRVFDWAIWVDLWSYEFAHSFEKDKSFWHKEKRRFSWHFLDTILGRHKTTEMVLNEHDGVLLQLPERSYRAHVKLVRYWRKRPRWFGKTFHRVDIEPEIPVPIPGKGESAWDIGDDAIYSSSQPTGNISKAVDDFVESIMKRREKYGGVHWQPSPPTVEEKLDEQVTVR